MGVVGGIMADSFDELTARFLNWFKQLPGATFSDAIAIKDLRSRKAGRGIGMLPLPWQKKNNPVHSY